MKRPFTTKSPETWALDRMRESDRRTSDYERLYENMLTVGRVFVIVAILAALAYFGVR